MQKRFIFWVLLIFVIFVRFVSTQPVYTTGQRVRITSVVSSEPIRYETSQNLRLSGLKFSLPLYPEIYYGDTIVVEGEVDHGKLKNAKLVEVREGSIFLFNFRKKLIEFYEQTLPQPHSSLVAGITLGSKSNLSANLWEDLKKTGTAHVVVASGMNVTLVAKFLISVLILFISRKKAIWITLVGILTYSLISGLDAPIVRAAIMGSVAFSAQGFGRLTQAWRAFLMAAMGMLIVKPDWMSDIGFILSFAATAGLMLFEEKIKKKIMFIPGVLREGISTSVAAQVFVAPILFATFGQFNPLSPIVNALVLPTVAPTMVIGGFGGVVGLISPFLGKLVLFLATPLTSWFILIIQLFS